MGVKKKRDDVETYTDANLEEGECVGGSEQDNLYGNENEANKETDSGVYTNTIV